MFGPKEFLIILLMVMCVINVMFALGGILTILVERT